MSKFFINRPIVAMVIAILMVIVGAVTITSLPVALFPDIAPPEVQVVATYVGADAQTIEQSVANANRTADERRRQYELHVFAELNSGWRNAAHRGLRRQDQSEYGSHPHQNTRNAGGFTTSERCHQFWRHRTENSNGPP
jgi:hypothetical protein